MGISILISPQLKKKCTEFITCTYNFKNLAVVSTIKTLQNNNKKEKKKQHVHCSLEDIEALGKPRRLSPVAASTNENKYNYSPSQCCVFKCMWNPRISGSRNAKLSTTFDETAVPTNPISVMSHANSRPAFVISINPDVRTSAFKRGII